MRWHARLGDWFFPHLMASCTGPNAMHVLYDFQSTAKMEVDVKQKTIL